MPRTPNTPRVAKRREREKLVVSQMIALNCAGHHDRSARTETAFCGEPVCPECLELDRYAVLRTERCRMMATKTSCKNCAHHCYPPKMEQRIRDVMRYSGPRMLLHHPVAAVRHMLGK